MNERLVWLAWLARAVAYLGTKPQQIDEFNFKKRKMAHDIRDDLQRIGKKWGNLETQMNWASLVQCIIHSSFFAHIATSKTYPYQAPPICL